MFQNKSKFLRLSNLLDKHLLNIQRMQPLKTQVWMSICLEKIF